MAERAAAVPFHTALVTRGQAIAMLSGAAIMLSIAMGVRQSLGLFQTPVVQDLGHRGGRFRHGDCGAEHRLGLHASRWPAPSPTASGRAGSRWPASLIYVAGLVITATRDQRRPCSRWAPAC